MAPVVNQVGTAIRKMTGGSEFYAQLSGREFICIQGIQQFRTAQCARSQTHCFRNDLLKIEGGHRLLGPHEGVVAHGRGLQRLARSMATAWRVLTNWPNGIERLLDAPESAKRLIHLVRPPANRAALPELTKLFGDHFGDEDTLLKVKPSARLLGATETEVADARSRKELKTAFVIRYGAVRSGFQRDEIESLSVIRKDRMTDRVAAQMLRLPTYGLDQLVEARLLNAHDHPWLTSRYGSPVITGADMQTFLQLLRQRAVDHVDDAVPLKNMMRGFGGGPKPWGQLFSLLSTGSIPFVIDGAPDRRCEIQVASSDRRRLMALEPPPWRNYYTQEEALEILNLSPKNGFRIASLDRASTDSDSWWIVGESLEISARELMGPAEAMARSGLAHKTLERALRERKCDKVDGYWWNRKQLELQARDLLF